MPSIVIALLVLTNPEKVTTGADKSPANVPVAPLKFPLNVAFHELSSVKFVLLTTKRFELSVICSDD